MFLLTRIKPGRQLLLIALLMLGLQQLASAGYIKAKAELAQILIGVAWRESVATGGLPVKPWPWADTWPVARLKVATQAVDLFVLAGTTGNALAFGPGYETASVRPGSPGLSLIGGHRDTHFAFLRHLQVGTGFQLQLSSGELLNYRVSSSHIADSNRDRLPENHNGPNELLLVTCYPFDTLLTGGPLRYVVSAQYLRSAKTVAAATPYPTALRGYQL